MTKREALRVLKDALKTIAICLIVAFLLFGIPWNALLYIYALGGAHQEYARTQAHMDAVNKAHRDAVHAH
jgi:hypothetical protein